MDVTDALDERALTLEQAVALKAEAADVVFSKDLNGLLGDSKGEVHKTIVSIGEAARAFKRTADNVDSRLKEIAAGITRFTGPGLRQYEALAADGRKTLDEINKAVRSIKRDPSQVIFGGKPELPEYKGR